MRRESVRIFAGVRNLCLFGLAAASLHAEMAVSLEPSSPPPAPVGMVVTWTATVSDAAPGRLVYRFSSQAPSGDLHVIRDYGPLSSLAWTASEQEGDYQLVVTVVNRDTGESATATGFYQFTSRVLDGMPVISDTVNPLVFLYSAPECPAGSRMRVQFLSSEGVVQSTPPKSCQSGFSMNFYLAGLRPGIEYSVSHVIEGSEAVGQGPTIKVTTPAAQLDEPRYRVLKPAADHAPTGVLLQSAFGDPVATDLSGNLVWYYTGGLSFLTRPEPGGYFLGIIEDATLEASGQVLREFDLAGTTQRETNAERINEQLESMGRPPITAFHHEVRGLPDGSILALASTEKILNDVQGPGAVDVLGDTILVLNRDLQVTWVWNAFDHLDPYRKAVLGETCTQSGGGCPPLRLAQLANDWLHGNSLQLTGDGNILYSARHQDWLIKIDYRNGQGTGDVLWRLGRDGDFRIASSDSDPWFSHQHDANFVDGDGSTTLALFDNGNTRRAKDASAHSRGQVLRLDEQQRMATLSLSVDLGDYSAALGSAQRLANGDYHFNLGWIGAASSESVEFDTNANEAYAISVDAPLYRSFRMADLYTP